MAQHVQNIQTRTYVTLDEGTRQLAPSALGLALVHAYLIVDPGLVLPAVRAAAESRARGRAAAGLVARSP